MPTFSYMVTIAAPDEHDARRHMEAILDDAAIDEDLHLAWRAARTAELLAADLPDADEVGGWIDDATKVVRDEILSLRDDIENRLDRLDEKVDGLADDVAAAL